MQILIIEDEKRLADALGQIMQEARYQADIVYDGQGRACLCFFRRLRCDRAGCDASRHGWL